MVAVRLWPHPTFAERVAQSRLVLAADGSVLRMTLAEDQQFRLWTPLESISPSFIQAIQLKEDRYFYRHPGVNPSSLLRAMFATYLYGDRQGGSTITMQLARRWYHLNTRTPVGKIRQIVAAVWLELCYSKHDILEAYANLVPMGGNAEGVAAASRIYFGKEASALTLPESLALAVIPQNPGLRGDFMADFQASRQRLVTQWRNTYPTDAQTSALLDLPIDGLARARLPFRAPHFVEEVLQRFPEKAVLQTTLDVRLQTLVENLLQSYIREQHSKGIKNATAMLVDTRDLSVKAYVGSANYFDAGIAGQVNGIEAKRSPGSTLKPFLYGLALDQGIIHPLTILKDAPTAFGPFHPENFDGNFLGPIHARDALTRSRNIPAVWLATQVARPSLYDFLKMAGVSQLRPESYYGLALTLGGGELSTEELATLYSLLANRGTLHRLRYLQDSAIDNGLPLLSADAAFMVIDMLKGNLRRDRNGPAPQTSAWTVAWKTGTSWGFRDAWTAGLVGHYVLVVWIGNFDGMGNPAFVGIDTAAPLFFRIADALPLLLHNEQDRINGPTATLKRVAVCEASGDLPNRWCPQTIDTWFIPGKSPIKVSDLHRQVIVDNTTGKTACPPFDPATTHAEIFEFWSSEIFQQFRDAGIPRRQPPDNPVCKLQPDNHDPQSNNPVASYAVTTSSDQPVIVYPLNGVTYSLRLSSTQETIPLQARTAGGVKTVYWFADNAFIGKANWDETLGWRPEHSGRYRILAVDDKGGSANKPLSVEFIP
ncbi:MAG TPA: penicillin-binding protein 1C [Pseudomonadales bacterium]|nr:penicillin-binding protein 1C [Pseudomonadales bacterium]